VVVGVSFSALLPATGVQVVFVDEAGAKQSGALEVLWSTGFEHVSPVRSFGSFHGQRSFQGSWWFATTGEHVGFESWVERPVDRTSRGQRSPAVSAVCRGR
jgi:hypothetical protein